jgi:hypothetical protein
MLSSDARSTACVSFDGRFQQELLQGDRCVCVRPVPNRVVCRRSVKKFLVVCVCAFLGLLDAMVEHQCIGFLFLGADGCLGIVSLRNTFYMLDV